MIKVDYISGRFNFEERRKQDPEVKGLKLSHRGYVLENGRVALEGKGEDLLNNEQVRRTYLGE